MSRDSSRSYIHLHASRHADLFEEFTQPLVNLNSTTSHSTSASHLPAYTTLIPKHHFAPTTTQLGTTASTSIGGASNPALANPLAPGHSTLLPPEDIPIPAQHMPTNPEDEDDVVPDQHAAFGITRAMRTGLERERAWRDFMSLEGLVRGDGLGDQASRNGAETISSGIPSGFPGPRGSRVR